MALNFHMLTVRQMSLAALVMALVTTLSLSAVGAQPKQGMPRGERHESKHEIDELEQTWRDAVLHSNIQAMDTLLAEDYIAITANGTLQSKDETLANMKNGSLHLNALDFSDRKVRFYGQTALVTSRAEVTGSTGGGELQGSYRYTRVYVRDPKGAWKIVSFEASRIHEPGDHR